MIKFVGQAEWVVRAGAKRLDSYAPWALIKVIQPLNQNEIEFRCHPDVRFGETAKAEALIGPPPCPEPILTYAKWYLKCIQDLTGKHIQMHSVHAEVRFPPPTPGPDRVYQFDLYAELLEDSGGRHGRDVMRVLWIDIFRTEPSLPPQRIVDTLPN